MTWYSACFCRGSGLGRALSPSPVVGTPPPFSYPLFHYYPYYYLFVLVVIFFSIRLTNYGNYGYYRPLLPYVFEIVLVIVCMPVPMTQALRALSTDGSSLHYYWWKSEDDPNERRRLEKFWK